MALRNPGAPAPEREARALPQRKATSAAVDNPLAICADHRVIRLGVPTATATATAYAERRLRQVLPAHLAEPGSRATGHDQLASDAVDPDGPRQGAAQPSQQLRCPNPHGNHRAHRPR